MALSDAALKRYQYRIGVYRTTTASGLIALFNRLEAYDEEQVDEFTARAQPVLAGAKVAAVALSAAFFALRLRIPPVAVNADEIPVEPKTRDPFTALWHALAMGRPYEEAVQVGRSTVEAVGFDFVQSSARRTGDLVAERSGRRVRWERVPGPTACDWCRSVAGPRYLSAESADFGHQRCDCDAVPA